MTIEKISLHCIFKYVNKTKPTIEKILPSISKLDTDDKLDADKLRKLLSGMVENQLLELSDNVYKIKGVL